MRRITTPTAAQDLFGTARNGFTDGSAPSPPPTHLNADFFNQVQEEIARAVEGNGATVVADGGTPNYFQLDDAIADSARLLVGSAFATYILDGLLFTTAGTSLSTTLSEGRMVFNGRRYFFTTAKLTDAGFLSWGPLTANRDHYFFIAPENPGALATPPNRATVYVTRLDVANGASAPATPAGTVRFAMLVTNGTDITSATYYLRGPRLGDTANTFVALRPLFAATGSGNAALHPSSAEVDLGYHQDDDDEGYFSHGYLRRLHIRTAANTNISRTENLRYTETSVITAGATVDENLLLAADYPDGTVAYISICGTARSTTDPTDGYTFRVEGHAQLDGGVWSLEGSGAAPAYQDGNTAIADGLTANLRVDASTTVQIRLTGHSTDITRWLMEVHLIINGD